MDRKEEYVFLGIAIGLFAFLLVYVVRSGAETLCEERTGYTECITSVQPAYLSGKIGDKK